MSGRFNDSTNSNYTQQQDAQANALSKFGNDRNNVIASGQTGQTYNPQTGAVAGQALDAGTQQQTYAPAQAGGSATTDVVRDRSGNTYVFDAQGYAHEVAGQVSGNQQAGQSDSINLSGQNQRAVAQGENNSRSGHHHRAVAQGENYNLSGQNPQAVAQGDNINLSGQQVPAAVAQGDNINLSGSRNAGAAYDNNGSPIGIQGDYRQAGQIPGQPVVAQGEYFQPEQHVYTTHHHPKHSHLDQARRYWVDDRTGQIIGVEGQEPVQRYGGGHRGIMGAPGGGYEGNGQSTLAIVGRTAVAVVGEALRYELMSKFARGRGGYYNRLPVGGMGLGGIGLGGLGLNSGYYSGGYYPGYNNYRVGVPVSYPLGYNSYGVNPYNYANPYSY